jgi:hypothetical protein
MFFFQESFLELHELVLPAARLLQRNLSILRPKSMGAHTEQFT